MILRNIFRVGFPLGLLAFLLIPQAIATPLPKQQVITPTTPKAREKMSQGLQQIQQGQMTQAIALLQEAVTIDPTLWQAHYNLGLALRQVGELPSAAQAFYNTVTLQPEFALGYANIGGILVDVQNWSQAQIYLQRALTLDKDLAIAHYNLGLVHRQLGRLSQAIQSWETTRSLAPDLIETDIQLAEAYLNGDRPQDAKRLVTALLRTNAELVPALYLQGRIAEAEGNAEAALNAFRQASTLDPTYANAYYGAARVLMNNNRATAAKPILDYALFLYNQQGQSTWVQHTQALQQRLP